METSKNLTRQVTLDELIYLQEASPANPTALQANERAKKMTDISGQRCCALFKNAPRSTLWAKTFAALLVGMEGWSSKRCALTWKLKGTPYNRSYFQLQVSALPTDEIESGLLLTPTTREEVMDTDKFKKRMEKYDNGTTVPNLATQIHNLLPTVKTTDHHKQRTLDENGENRSHTTGTKYGLHLTQMAEAGMLPTPMAQESDKITGKENQDSLTKRARLETGKTSQLNPHFVEEMMGFPKNWTASPFQSGEKKA